MLCSCQAVLITVPSTETREACCWPTIWFCPFWDEISSSEQTDFSELDFYLCSHMHREESLPASGSLRQLEERHMHTDTHTHTHTPSAGLLCLGSKTFHSPLCYPTSLIRLDSISVLIISTTYTKSNQRGQCPTLSTHGEAKITNTFFFNCQQIPIKDQNKRRGGVWLYFLTSIPFHSGQKAF